jgi:hypothetical protein
MGRHWLGHRQSLSAWNKTFKCVRANGRTAYRDLNTTPTNGAPPRESTMRAHITTG